MTHPELLTSGLEELLRYDSPVRDATFRVATSPIDLHGRTIAPGDLVSLLIGSANRDETRFPLAHQLDLSRDRNEHLAFGRGPHFCVGAALARMEGLVAFRLLLDRLGDVRGMRGCAAASVVVVSLGRTGVVVVVFSVVG
jgi:cytochrome P450